ncbi:MAG: adenylate kinase [Muribaculaceae bacterium]|nr:adenylate kinase [Muribaculaceae bacterium]
MLNLVIFGAPGSGKGTQSAKLIDEYSLYHISTGEVLREEIASGSELGKLADSYISKGQLIPDDLMISILDEILTRHLKDREGIVFDGFPRTIPQAEALASLLEKHGTELHAVIGLEVPEEELIDRMIKRGQQTGRADDNAETIKNRLAVYHNQTRPVKDFYIGKDKYIAVNGSGVVDEIFADIRKGIEQATGQKSKK